MSMADKHKPSARAVDKAKPGAAAQAGQAAPDEPRRKGWLSWAVGWLLVPATAIGLLWGAGVLVGVHLSDSWYARMVVWIVELF